MRMSRILLSHVVCRLHNVYSHYLINGTIVKNKNFFERKMCFDFLYNIYLKLFSF